MSETDSGGKNMQADTIASDDFFRLTTRFLKYLKRAASPTEIVDFVARKRDVPKNDASLRLLEALDCGRMSLTDDLKVEITRHRKS